MDEKEVRKAIDVIKGYRTVDEFMQNTDRLQYCDVAIEALEKQLRLKPVREDDKEYTDYKCPACGKLLLSTSLGDKVFGEREKACDCGQKLDWSE